MSLTETTSIAETFKAMYPAMPATAAITARINARIDADFLDNIST
jgi:hypothetical protein